MVTIFKLANSLQIRDIKWKCDSFDSKNIVFNTSYKICLQNVETDCLEIFAKCWNWLFRNICKMLKTYVPSGKNKVKDKWAVNDWYLVKKFMFW